MRKIILILVCILTIGIKISYSSDFVIDEIHLRPAKEVSIPKGTLVKVYNVKQISSQFLDEGDEITLLNATDVYMGETNVIPKKTIFYGNVEKIREPVQGTNAAIIIKMNKMITPEGIPYEINGYVSADGSKPFLGGGIAPPLYYTRMPHYTQWKLSKWKVGAAQYCETNTRQFGVHTVVKSGAELFLILQDNFVLVQ